MKIKVSISKAEFVDVETAADSSAVLRRHRIDPTRKYQVGADDQSEFIHLYQEERDLLPAATEVEDEHIR